MHAVEGPVQEQEEVQEQVQGQGQAHEQGQEVDAAAAAGSASSGAAASTPSSPASSGTSGSALPLRLEAYLPEAFLEAFPNESLYQWQVECLHAEGVLAGRNLVCCAPTSGSKSQVTEVLMLRRLHRTQRPFLLVLPCVALCAEKAVHLERLRAQAAGAETRSHVKPSGAFGCRWWESQGHIFPWRCPISASPNRISA
eukprot:jgi/Tetstr1/429106/TSEL_019068.t1